jgi:predicted TPR repeat methyltransferase
LKLALADASKNARSPPSAFVEALFDEYAPNFDVSLVEKLGYRVPELLAAAIEAQAPGRRFVRAIDLGCGTGLMGEQLRASVGDLIGYDISAEMLAQADAKGIYDRLERPICNCWTGGS